MTDRGWKLPRILRVDVEESFGQSAAVEWRAGWTSDAAAESAAGQPARRASSRRPIRPS